MKTTLELKGGLVDLQVNGYLGVEFSSPKLTMDGIRTLTKALVERGTGAYCPTVITSPEEIYRRNLPLIASAMRDPELKGRLLGIHLEGPFISPEDGARGAHSREYVRRPDPDFLDELQRLADGNVVLLTLAPEIPGALDLIRHAARRWPGMALGIGHSLAGSREIAAAVEAGARFSTHLGNGIPSSINRHLNPIWPQLADERLSAFLITDGHHIPADFIKVAFRAKGASGCVVTSDSSDIGGMPPGEYFSLGKKVVLEPSGKLRCADSEYLAGSSACMIQCMDHLASLGFLRPGELAMAGRFNALSLLDVRSARLPKTPVVRLKGSAFSVV
ncbi:MAG: amidohydrolase family protein [Planctomycetota bacterium]|nr:amidohydrolase family protein [Planctomycetota bacterium]